MNVVIWFTCFPLYNEYECIINLNIFEYSKESRLWLGGSVVGALSHTPKGYRFDPWSGHVQEGLMGVGLSPLSLSLFLSLINESISSGKDQEKEKANHGLQSQAYLSFDINY